jgi:hypothetical protein
LAAGSLAPALGCTTWLKFDNWSVEKMPVFISYSSRDDAAFSMLCFALKSQRVEYWDTKTMKVGVSLREELREGIKKCEVCVFLATRNSIDSAWCSAELGAFWGAGIRVLVFITDPSLSEDQIPPQFKGDLWTRNIEEVLRGVNSEISAAYSRKLAASEAERTTGLEKPRLVSEMTIGMFHEVISSLQSNEPRRLFETMILLREAFSDRVLTHNGEALFENDADVQVFAMPLLNSLIGISERQIKSIGERYWEETFTLVTDTGTWFGFSRDSFPGGPENCLLIHFDSSLCDAAVITNNVSVGRNTDEELIVKFTSIIASSGSVILGNPSDFSYK